jgi:lysozyme family protein
MDSFFDRCFAFTLAAEGGYSANPADPGNWTGGKIGAGVLRGTKFGISAAAHPTLDIATLSQADAEAIYRANYWVQLKGDALPLPLAFVMFDAAVNSGVRRAVIWLQQAAGLVADGVLGNATMNAIKNANSVELAKETLARRLDYNARLPAWATFGLGWSRRLIALAAQISSAPP